MYEYFSNSLKCLLLIIRIEQSVLFGFFFFTEKGRNNNHIQVCLIMLYEWYLPPYVLLRQTGGAEKSNFVTPSKLFNNSKFQFPQL